MKKHILTILLLLPLLCASCSSDSQYELIENTKRYQGSKWSTVIPGGWYKMDFGDPDIFGLINQGTVDDTPPYATIGLSTVRFDEQPLAENEFGPYCSRILQATQMSEQNYKETFKGNGTVAGREARLMEYTSTDKLGDMKTKKFIVLVSPTTVIVIDLIATESAWPSFQQVFDTVLTELSFED